MMAFGKGISYAPNQIPVPKVSAPDRSHDYEEAEDSNYVKEAKERKSRMSELPLCTLLLARE
jgi:hypothetical protein